MTLAQPDMRPIRTPQGERYILQEDYAYEWSYRISPRIYSTRQRLTIRKAFVSDGASNPWWLWSLVRITPDGLHRPAALVHDYLYLLRGVLPAGVQEELHWEGGAWHWRPVEHAVWTRKDADRLFARILREAGVSKCRRRLMYLGVRAGGWIHWRKDRKICVK